MLSLRNTASMLGVLQSQLDPVLQGIIRLRMDQLGEHVQCDFSELVQFVIVEPGDPPDVIEVELGFSILQNMVDGVRYGQPDFMPSFEWLQDHGSWFELAYILSDDGFGYIVLIQDHPGVDPAIRALCIEYAYQSPVDS